MSAPLLVSMTDYWRDLDPRADPLVQMILSSTDAQYIDSPADADLVIFSVFGVRHGYARGTRLGFSGEPRNALGGDWTMDWRFVGSKRHFRYPYWVHHMLLYHSGTSIPMNNSGSRFCNFTYSNSQCGVRNAFFVMLSRQRPVDALGMVYNNAKSVSLGARNDPEWPLNKIRALQDYRFTIAFENEEHIGYTTEKIVDAWLAGSVPIYWGNPAIGADFAAGSYLSAYEYPSLGRLVEAVIDVDDSPSVYAALQERNPFRTGEGHELLEGYSAEVRRFLGHVIEDALLYQGRARRSSIASGVGRLRNSYATLRKRARMLSSGS